MNGLLVIDKPGGMTSRDAVNRIQKWFPRKTRIGHTGTLDPLATGVLVVCIGSATRLADYVQAMGKSYKSRFRLGATSPTDDADGDLRETPEVISPSREQIDAALASFQGSIDQLPPAFSALKVSGKRAHTLARAGDEVPLVARTVRIDAIRVTGYAWPFLDLEIDCGKGTYIRSIARDLGAKLGCGGLVQTLRRTRVGSFLAEQSVGLDIKPPDLELLPLSSAVAALPQVKLDSEREQRFRRGQALEIVEPLCAIEAAVVDASGELIGIGERRLRQLKPKLVVVQQT